MYIYIYIYIYIETFGEPGWETSQANRVVNGLELFFTWVFAVELLLNMAANLWTKFVRNGWSMFDLIVVPITFAVCVYVCVCVCVYTHIHTYTYTHTQTHTHTYRKGGGTRSPCVFLFPLPCTTMLFPLLCCSLY